MTTPVLSVVVPLHNEGAIVAELVRRLQAALGEVSGATELVLVDDASTDETPRLLSELGGVRVVTMSENVGQFRATCAGLSAAKGEAVLVLDGDLQDPPELIPALLAALGGHALAFAVKTERRDPLWFRLGRAGYRALATLGRGAPPSGAGSYCVMTRALAHEVAASPWSSANLSAVAVSLAPETTEWPTVPYAKAERYDGRSRVGPLGLIREALGSLRVLGATPRLALLLLALCGGVAAWLYWAG